MQISKRYSDFKDFLNEAVPYLEENAKLFLVPDQWVTEIKSSASKYSETYDAYSNKAKRTAIVVGEMGEIYHATLELFRRLQRFLKNGTVDLTIKEKRILGVHIDKKRRAVVPPLSYYPTLELLQNEHLYAILQASAPTLPDFNHNGLPKDAKFIGLEIAYTNIGDPEPKQEDYRRIKNQSSATFAVNFKEENVGKLAHIIAWYESPTGEESPISQPISLIVN